MSGETPHRRRPRYAGKYPRRFEEKYKELDPLKYPDTVAKVLASGKTPAGSHVPIMTSEVLEVLQPRPGGVAVDCTLGFGGHASAILEKLHPGGVLLALDVDPSELARTEARLREAGHGEEALRIRRSNFAGMATALADEGLGPTDCILADLGVSSMQLDTPDRGFSTKLAGPLDMRMNPLRGAPASQFLAGTTPQRLARILAENSDEPYAEKLAAALAGRSFALTTDLSEAIQSAVPDLPESERAKCVRRVFQAIRIEVNGEFSALDALLRSLPDCLKSGGRAAILTFHSGEDRRVKKAFQAGLRDGIYQEVARDVIRALPSECRSNPRATSAKLRWAIRSARE